MDCIIQIITLVALLYVIIEIRDLKNRDEGFAGIDMQSIKEYNSYAKQMKAGSFTIPGNLTVNGKINNITPSRLVYRKSNGKIYMGNTNLNYAKKTDLSPYAKKTALNSYAKYNDKLRISSTKSGYGYLQQHSSVYNDNNFHGMACQKYNAKVAGGQWNDFKLVKA